MTERTADRAEAGTSTSTSTSTSTDTRAEADQVTAHDRFVGHPHHRVQHPAYAKQLERRAADRQLRVADGITRFAGSMAFIYIHVVIFAVWCGTGLFGRDRFPFNFLTLSVSLEAIFLSTFVMIGQNRQNAFASAKADHDFTEQQRQLERNTALVEEVHQIVLHLRTEQARHATPAEDAARPAGSADPAAHPTTEGTTGTTTSP